MIKSPSARLKEAPPAPAPANPARPFLSRPSTLWGAAMLGLLVSLYLDQPGNVSGYWLLILQICGIYAIESMSLGLINGFTGQFSLGHAVFMGVGAYVSALLTSRWQEWPFIPSLLLGGGAAALVAFLVGLPVFKLKGDYVCVITLFLNLISTSLLWNFAYAGGPTGFPGIHPDSNTAWIWVWVVITYMMLRNLIFSTHGRAMLAIREDEVAAPLVGVNPYKYKVMSFVIACFFAGIGGGLYAHTVTFIAPQSFTFFISIDILAMSLLGGTGSLMGAALGAVGLRFLYEAFRPFGLWRLVVAPMVLVVVMIFRPIGLYGLKEPWFLRPHWNDEPVQPQETATKKELDVDAAT